MPGTGLHFRKTAGSIAMLTQHLTVAQSKYLFIGKDCMAYRCTDGLNPQDLERHELRPLVVATLSVEGLGIYWQRLYFGDEPIPLESFLYLAWTEFHTLGGMPGHLLVESELLDDYPLRRVLGQMDKEKVIKKVAIGHGHPFGSTRRQSQNLVKHSMVSLEELTEHRLESQEAVLARLNQGLEGYHRVWENSPRPGHAEDAFQNHRLSPVHLPHWPQHLVGLDIADWMKRQARSVPPMAPHEELKIIYQTGWMVSVTKKPFPTVMLRKAVRTVMMTGNREPAGLYDVDDLLWFRSLVRGLPFPPQELFGSVLELGKWPPFLNRRLAINGATADRLESLLERSLERKGLVLFPESEDAFCDSLNLLGGGGDERCCAELVGGPYHGSFRVFALDDDVWLNLLAIPRGSPADTPGLAECLHQTLGEIDVGAPGLAAINYWLENLIQGHSWNQSLLLLGMVESMLATIAAWREADRPADHR